MSVSEDFTGLTGRFRGELVAHSYRMLGSAGIARIVAFQDTGLFGLFGLPPEYRAAAAGPTPAQD